ncbi:U-box domain-containing protein 9 [Magnolia sinica]|uniref:U-box domain-containing protein 9 n=1 Tax=Magnolia sinica TaxID=86752 RepID=UPI002659DD34|nr:U-box domain-containing protein 9 [Magnolia sinica]
MAKSGSSERVDPSSVAKATELKRELQRLVKSIAEEEDVQIEAFDQAAHVLSALKDLKFSRSQPSLPKFHRSQRSLSKNSDSDSVPEHFRCPISTQIMKDPVILSSGLTYDRPYVQSWLSQGYRTCPLTREVLSHSLVTPNLLVQNMISEWCKNQGIELGDRTAPVHKAHRDEAITPEQRAQVNTLLCKISSEDLPEQKMAIKELRMLTKRSPSVRAQLGEDPEVIPLLTSLLKMAKRGSSVQEDVVATILNFSILDDNNKKIVGDNPETISLLIAAVRIGSMECRGTAAATLFTLSALDSNKAKICECDLNALEALACLLEEGNAIAKKDAASAIFNLCAMQSNRSRAVKCGVVRVVLKTLKDGYLVDEMLAILAMLSSSQEAADAMCRHFGVPHLLRILRESTSPGSRENVAAILFSICMNDRVWLRDLREEEETNGTISELTRNGTPRARRKATAIIERMKRTTTHTT